MSESRSEENEAATSGAEEPEEFLNRAARRAKGKQSGKPAAPAPVAHGAGPGAVQRPRQYGARRSGG
jgi:hypothetical protein